MEYDCRSYEIFGILLEYEDEVIVCAIDKVRDSETLRSSFSEIRRKKTELTEDITFHEDIISIAIWFSVFGGLLNKEFHLTSVD